jgi:predicted GNAT family N-acyltransferase
VAGQSDERGNRASHHALDIVVKLAETEQELEGAIAVRFRVFVAEQSVPPEEELDDADAAAAHAVALAAGQVVGTGRLVRRGPETVQIGRMAVDLSWRRQGVGGRIIDYLEAQARAQGMRRSFLHAQEYVKAFYAAHGYREHGQVFLDAGIRHIEMRKEL